MTANISQKMKSKILFSIEGSIIERERKPCYNYKKLLFLKNNYLENSVGKEYKYLLKLYSYFRRKITKNLKTVDKNGYKKL